MALENHTREKRLWSSVSFFRQEIEAILTSNVDTNPEHVSKHKKMNTPLVSVNEVIFVISQTGIVQNRFLVITKAVWNVFSFSSELYKSIAFFITNGFRLVSVNHKLRQKKRTAVSVAPIHSGLGPTRLPLHLSESNGRFCHCPLLARMMERSLSLGEMR